MKTIRKIYELPKDAIYSKMSSPVGELTLIASTAGLHAILWDKEQIDTLTQSDDDATIINTSQQLTEYFQGKRQIFDLPLAIHGTNFQLQVWQQLLNIPYATTISYRQQAERIGDKNKARAVGRANGLNPIPIIIPCHRVIGSNGHLVGFGGGIEKKIYLLELESSKQHFHSHTNNTDSKNAL